MNSQRLAIDDIRLDGGTQSRVAIDESTVADYAELIEESTALPPVVVFHDGTDYWLVDGFHRLLATQRIGAVDIEADVHPGTQHDARVAACSANRVHGLRRTNADKRRAVEMMIELAPDLSSREIARHVGVTHSLVNAVRRGAEVEDSSTRRAPRPTAAPAPSSPTVQQEARAAVGSSLPAAEPPAVKEQREPGKVETASTSEAAQAPDEGPSLDDLIDELQVENESLRKRIEVIDAADPAAEALKWRMAYESAQQRQGEAMDRAKQATDREKWAARQLTRCGKAIGEADPSKVAAAVEAFVRAHKVAA